MVFGTIGTFTRYIELPSSVLCFSRAALAVVTILVYFAITGKKPDIPAIKKNLPKLILLGALMSFNWVCQFEAFARTTIAISTVCYYTQPIFLIIGAAIVFKEKLSAKKVICIFAAFFGMMLVSGIIGGGGVGKANLSGVLFAVSGAITYAIIVLINKSLKDISTFDTTMAQLGFAAIVITPYILLTEDISAIHLSTTGLICTLIMGIVHTGIAYVIYFRSVSILDAQNVGIISYIDPVEAVLLSALFLREPITINVIVGAVMILGATAVSELTGNRR